MRQLAAREALGYGARHGNAHQFESAERSRILRRLGGAAVHVTQYLDACGDRFHPEDRRAPLFSLTETYGAWVYGVIFLIVFAETGLVVAPILPGDSLLFAAGALCGAGLLNPWIMAAVLLSAAIIGDAVNYSVGRSLGPKVFSAHDQSSRLHRLLNREHLEKAHAFFEKHGGKAIVIARFVPIVRTFVPVRRRRRLHELRRLRLLQRRRRVPVGRLVLRPGLHLRQRPDRESRTSRPSPSSSSSSRCCRWRGSSSRPGARGRRRAIRNGGCRGRRQLRCVSADAD